MLTKDLYNDSLIQADVGLGMTLEEQGENRGSSLAFMPTEMGRGFLNYCGAETQTSSRTWDEARNGGLFLCVI